MGKSTMPAGLDERAEIPSNLNPQIHRARDAESGFGKSNALGVLGENDFSVL
ncbi:MAG: hypothetical protein WBP85_13785 [Terracidiphilus sp.]